MKITITFNISREIVKPIVEKLKFQTFELKVTTVIVLLEIAIWTTIIKLMFLKVLLFSNVEIN